MDVSWGGELFCVGMTVEGWRGIGAEKKKFKTPQLTAKASIAELNCVGEGQNGSETALLAPCQA